MTDTITSGADFVFRFELTPDGYGFDFRQIQDQPEDMSTVFREFVERVKGY